MPLSRKDLAPPVEALAVLAILVIPAALAGGCMGSGRSELQEAGSADVPGRLRLPPFVWYTGESGGNRRVRNFLGLLYHQVSEEARGAEEPRSGAASPTATSLEAATRQPPHVVGSAAPDSRLSNNPTLPGDAVVRHSALHVLWPIYLRESTRRADGRRTETRRFLPFLWSRRQTEKSGAGSEYTRLRLFVLGPIFSLRSDDYGRGMTEVEFLWPLGHYFSGLSRRREGEITQTFRFLPFVSVERTWRLGEAADAWDLSLRPRRGSSYLGEKGLPSASPADRVRLRVLQPLFGYERDTMPRTKRMFILGGVSSVDKKEKHPWDSWLAESSATPASVLGPPRKQLWGLWAHGRGPATDFEHQLLWQFFVVSRSGSEELASRPLVRSLEGSQASGVSFALRQAQGRPGEGQAQGGPALSSSKGGERPSDLWRATKWLFSGSPRRLVRLGPIASYEADWRSDWKRFSTFFGFFSYAREGRSRTVRFLWFIPWRLREKP